MRVLFDYQAFEMQTFGGVSKSYAEIISALPDDIQYMIELKENDNIHIIEKELVPETNPLGTINRKYFGKKYFKGQFTATRFIIKAFGHSHDLTKINQEHSIKLLKRGNFDIFEPTFYDNYFLPYLKGKPFVMTVHDMITEMFPQYFNRDDFQIIMKKKLCPLAAHIHTPSMKTKEDLVNILNINPDKITVIPHGWSNNPIIYKQKRQTFFDFPYILYVGQRFFYKNFVPFIRECVKIMKDIKDLKVVCTGTSFNDEEERLFDNLKIRDRVIHFFANDEQLQSLYQNAITFVYPSLYEGFGLPILEAWANGCPVMLNNASCFPEVGGDAAIFFEQKEGYNSDFYEKFMHLWHMSSDDRKALINKGLYRLENFSWEKSAKTLANIYRTI